MDRGMRIVLASVVLVGGILLAMPFRRPWRPAVPSEPDLQGELVLGQESGPANADPPIPPRTTARIAPAASSPLAPPTDATTASEPADAGLSPPALPRSYPRSLDESGYGWPRPMEMETNWSGGSHGSARTHKIVDGDTLATLAERYLGDADRSPELYEVNRDLLPNPEVLPIGLELKVPPRQAEAASSPSLMPQEPLVPIPPAS